MKRILSLLLLCGAIFSIFSFLVLPHYAQAADPNPKSNALFDFNLWRGTGDGGVNTCNVGKPCTFCDAIVVLANGISIMFSFALVAAVVTVAVGGFFSIIDPADPGKKKKGIGMMQSAGIGILIIIVAYPAVSLLLRTLVYYDESGHTISNLMPWSKITCR